LSLHDALPIWITAKRISGKYVYLGESMAGHGDAPARELKGLGTSTAEDYRPPGALLPATSARCRSGTAAGFRSQTEGYSESGPAPPHPRRRPPSPDRPPPCRPCGPRTSCCG